MKLKTIFSFFIFALCSSSFLFSMHSDNSEQITEKTVTRGQIIYDAVISFIKNQDEQDVIISNVATNIIEVSLQKAHRSVDEIVEGLSVIEPVKYVARKITDGFLSGAIKKKQGVILQVEQALKQEVDTQKDEVEPDLINGDQAVYAWAYEVLGDNFDIEADQTNKEILYNILCFSMHFARVNKKLFAEVISDISGVLSFIVRAASGLIHKKLVATIPELEEQVKVECFGQPEEEQEGECAVIVLDEEEEESEGEENQADVSAQEDGKQCLVM